MTVVAGIGIGIVDSFVNTLQNIGEHSMQLIGLFLGKSRRVGMGSSFHRGAIEYDIFPKTRRAVIVIVITVIAIVRHVSRPGLVQHLKNFSDPEWTLGRIDQAFVGDKQSHPMTVAVVAAAVCDSVV